MDKLLKEKDLEGILSKLAKSEGWLCLKMTILGFAGFPDRAILAYPGFICFAELKRPNEKLWPLQEAVKQRLERLGFKVYVIDSKELIKTTIDEIRTASASRLRN